MVLIDDADSELLKTWLIKHLEDASAEADSDVLADYVLALVKTDDPEPVAKANTIDNLRDFLGVSAESVVDAVFVALATRSYDPSAPASRPEPARPQPSNPRKRGHQDWEHQETQNGKAQSAAAGYRPTKQPRRGTRGGFDSRGGRHPHQYGQPSFQTHSALPQLPAPLPGMPLFDPNDPIASFMAMQEAAMGLLPGLPNMMTSSKGNTFGQTPRCNDYDTKGYCARGASCPFDHGNNSYVVPESDEYDPKQATLLHVQPSRTGMVSTNPNERGRGGNRGRGRASNRRSQFSHLGPNHDRSVTSIVVEQIPEDKFNEQTVHDFFGQFGNIQGIDLQAYKRLAIVTYDDYDSAKSAYDSPKVIFDNRFVKVYWHVPGEQLKVSSGNARSNSARRQHEDTQMQDDQQQVDPEELAKRQEEAQKKHEEQKRHREEAANQRKDLDAKMKLIEAEREKMEEALAKRRRGKVDASAAQPLATTDSGDNEQTKALKAQLAKLEAEAKSLGIDSEAPNHTPYFYRGRGSFRGRSRGRGSYNSAFRSGWAGARGGAVKRLDNRPKTISVTLTDGTYDDHDEALRQFLLFNASEASTLSKHPDRQDIALIAFPERYLGEAFMSAASSPEFPLAGKAVLSWYRPETSAEAPPTSDVSMKHAAEFYNDDALSGREQDAYDVADEDDRWA